MKTLRPSVEFTVSEAELLRAGSGIARASQRRAALRDGRARAFAFAGGTAEVDCGGMTQQVCGYVGDAAYKNGKLRRKVTAVLLLRSTQLLPILPDEQRNRFSAVRGRINIYKPDRDLIAPTGKQR